jgi:hypothetical protein
MTGYLARVIMSEIVNPYFLFFFGGSYLGCFRGEWF